MSNPSFIQIDFRDEPGSPFVTDSDYNDTFPSVLEGSLILTDYEKDDYEGGGHAVIRYASGKWDVRGLGHCSCYGPWEGKDSTFPPDGLYTSDQAITILVKYGADALAAAVAAFSGDRTKMKPFLQHKDRSVREAILRVIGMTATQEESL